jgi:CRP/FNR family cyclic AMP-dependent transcriptional regulator
MQTNRMLALQKMPIFGGIQAEILEFIVQWSEQVLVAAGEYFFHENDKAESMFVLETGEIEVLKLWNGRQHRLGRLRQGDCFGEMALMDLFPRSASVRATMACAAIEISTASFFQIYERNTPQFALIQMNLGREVSRRLRRADERSFRAKMGTAPPDADASLEWSEQP